MKTLRDGEVKTKLRTTRYSNSDTLLRALSAWGPAIACYSRTPHEKQDLPSLTASNLTHFLYAKGETDRSPEEVPGNLGYFPGQPGPAISSLVVTDRKVSLTELEAGSGGPSGVWRRRPRQHQGHLWRSSGKWPGPRLRQAGQSGQGTLTAEILRGFEWNLNSDKLTSLNPSNALQSKIK